MSFASAEASSQDGQPIALYKIQWGNTIWYYTSADQDIPFDDGSGEETYEAVGITDNGLTQGGDARQNDLQIELASNLPVVALFRGTPPSAPIYITVRRKHADEPDAPVWWIGTIGNLQRPTDEKAVIIGYTLAASLRRSGLRLSWQRTCPHIVYDGGCKVDPEDHKITGTVTAKDGTSITVSGALVGDEARFVGGFIKWDAEGNSTFERRGIEAEEGPGTIRLYGRPDRLDVGTVISLYPGCRHTPTACSDDFNNLPNYGGFDFLPGKSPFDGTPVF